MKTASKALRIVLILWIAALFFHYYHTFATTHYWSEFGPGLAQRFLKKK